MIGDLATQKCEECNLACCLTIAKAERIEPPGGKTNNVVSEPVRHKSGCTVTEAGWKLEISDLKRRGSVLSV